MTLIAHTGTFFAARAILATLVVATLLLSACGDPEPSPTPTQTPPPVSAPTLIPALPSAIVAAPASPTTVAPTSTPAPPTPTPLPTTPPDPDGLLAEGRQLHRYGDYAGARAAFNRVAGDAVAAETLRAEAVYDLGRAYLAEGAYGEALATFDRLEQMLAAAGADPNQFAVKEQFLRGEALVGAGRYADAIAAYWRFLDAYPWMSEAVRSGRPG